jgi:hypothetical protein
MSVGAAHLHDQAGKTTSRPFFMPEKEKRRALKGKMPEGMRGKERISPAAGIGRLHGRLIQGNGRAAGGITPPACPEASLVAVSFLSRLPDLPIAA